MKKHKIPYISIPLQTWIPISWFLITIILITSLTYTYYKKSKITLYKNAHNEVMNDLIFLQRTYTKFYPIGQGEDANEELNILSLNPNIKIIASIDDKGIVIKSNNVHFNNKPALKVLPGFDESSYKLAHQPVVQKLQIENQDKEIVGYYSFSIGRSPGAIIADRIGVLYMRYDLSNDIILMRNQLIRDLYPILIISLSIMFLLFLFIHWTFIRPIYHLTSITNNYKDGDYTSRSSLKGAGELLNLSNTINNMAINIEDTLLTIKHHSEFGKLISRISQEFINLPYYNTEIKIFESLVIVGNFIHCDRTFLFLYNMENNTMSASYEYCNRNIPEKKGYLQHIAIDERQLKKHLERKAFIFSSNTDSTETIKEYTPLTIDWKSFASFPLFINNNIYGFIGFETVCFEKEWDKEEIDLIQIIADLFSNALKRNDFESIIFERRRKIEALLNAPSSYITLLDKDANILEINDFYLSKFNLTRKGSIGKCLWDIIPKEKNLINEELFASVFSSGKPTQSNIEINGSYFETTYYPIQNTYGEIASIAIFSTNVTKHIETLKNLKKSEEKLIRVFHNSPTAQSILNLKNNKFIEVNNAFEELTGFNKNDLIGRTPFELNIIDHSIENEICNLINGEKVYKIDIGITDNKTHQSQALLTLQLFDFWEETCILMIIEKYA